MPADRERRRTPAVALAALVALAAVALLGCATVSGAVTPGVRPAPQSPAIAGTWYAGDLHCHTTWSDGDSPVSAVMASAEARGLDYLAITDHDTSMGGEPLHWGDPSYRSERLVLLYGVEWTSRMGHANVIAAGPFDYAPLWKANRALAPADAVAAARAQDAIFSINHPVNPLCPWEYELLDSAGLFVADTLEIWNGPFLLPSRNRASVLRTWDELLLRGLRVTVLGGSDSHQIHGVQRLFNLPGAPTTWVYAAERTAEAILGAIRAGRVSIAFAPGADLLELLADADGDGVYDVMMGDVIAGGRETGFSVAVSDPRAGGQGTGSVRRYVCHVYKNGTLLVRTVLRSGGSATFTDVPLPGDSYRAVLKGGPRVGPLRRMTMGRTLAITNPIYVRGE